MFLHVAGNRQLSTEEEFYYHLRKAKTFNTLERMVEGTFSRNGYLPVPTNGQIASLKKSKLLYPYGNLLAAAKRRREELEQLERPKAFGEGLF